MAKILVVEQDDGVRNVICKILRNQRYLIESFSDSQLGLIALTRENFDLIVTDWKMRPFDGDDMVRFARERGVNLPPIIVVTGGDLQTCHERFLAAVSHNGYLGYFSKPFDMEEFVKAVDNGLYYKEHGLRFRR